MRDDLRRALKDAMRGRDRDAVAALRTALAAIENAEAVAVDVDVDTGEPATTSASTTSEHIAGAAAGVGATEVARRQLADDDVAGIVAAEVDRLDDAAAEYERLGQVDGAEALRRQAAVLRSHLPA